MKCLQELAIRNQKTNSKPAKIITDDIYVDDLMTGASSREDLLKLKDEIVSIFNEPGLNLRK